MARDPFRPLVSLGMHFNGANQSKSFSDITGKTVTVSGSAVISTAQSRFGGASAYFGGPGAMLDFAASADFGFGTSDFTVECFTWLESIGTSHGIVDVRSSAAPGVFFVNELGRVAYYDPTVGGLSLSSVTLTTGAWHHLAWVRAGSYFLMAVNGGVTVVSSAFSSNFGSSNVCRVGENYSGSGSPLRGYLDDLRITKGFARYTSAYTVPTEAFPDLGSASDLSSSLLGAGTFLSAFPVPPPSLRNYPGISGSRNIYHGGLGSVIGSVKLKGSPANLPAVRRVRLFRDRDSVLVGEMWSDAAGIYAFMNLDPAEVYTAISYDHTGQFESVCASGLKATVAA